MPNMSYCRYRNTLSDLQDCFNDMQERLRRSETGTINGSFVEEVEGGYKWENEISPDDKNAQKELIDLCREIVELVEFEEEY